MQYDIVQMMHAEPTERVRMRPSLYCTCVPLVLLCTSCVFVHLALRS